MATPFTVYEDDGLIVERLPSGIMVCTPFGCWVLPGAGAISSHGSGDWHRLAACIIGRGRARRSEVHPRETPGPSSKTISLESL
jgi:hypothetical protein